MSPKWNGTTPLFVRDEPLVLQITHEQPYGRLRCEIESSYRGNTTGFLELEGIEDENVFSPTLCRDIPTCPMCVRRLTGTQSHSITSCIGCVRQRIQQ